MKIDSRSLEKRVRQYLTSDQASPVWEELTNSVLFNVIGSVIFACVGLGLVCTIILAKPGAKLLFGIIQSFVTLEVFRNPRDQFLQDPEKLRPLILATVIAGPGGHALALGTFTRQVQIPTELLARKASAFAGLYAAGSGGREQFDLVKLLKDDAYVPHRRRAVPPHNADGHKLVLFDMELDPRHVFFSKDRTGWVIAVATIDNPAEPGLCRGNIAQIPWPAVTDAAVEG